MVLSTILAAQFRTTGRRDMVQSMMSTVLAVVSLDLFLSVSS